MNRKSQTPFSCLALLLFLGAVMFTVQGCGVVGPPLPPEDIGIEAKIRSQQQASEDPTESDAQKIVPLDQEDVALPPLQPLGTQ